MVLFLGFSNVHISMCYTVSFYSLLLIFRFLYLLILIGIALVYVFKFLFISLFHINKNYNLSIFFSEVFKVISTFIDIINSATILMLYISFCVFLPNVSLANMLEGRSVASLGVNFFN